MDRSSTMAIDRTTRTETQAAAFIEFMDATPSVATTSRGSLAEAFNAGWNRAEDAAQARISWLERDNLNLRQSIALLCGVREGQAADTSSNAD